MEQFKAQLVHLQAKLKSVPQVRYVAVLLDDKAAPALLVTFAPQEGALQLQRLNAVKEGREDSMQLWALPAGGHLWTVEYEAEHADLAEANLRAAGVADRVTVRRGAGVDVLPTLVAHGPFDAVFLDADKVSYGHYARWALANLRPGGLILGDNAYLFGDLLDDTPRARGMRDFHAVVADACDSVCIPTPDGLVLAIKR